jgi:thiamine biosynthesis protein ThiS
LRLIINGESREFEDDLNVSELIRKLGLSSGRVAVELNLQVLRRADWSNTNLKDGDKLEIIHFVGGG